MASAQDGAIRGFVFLVSRARVRLKKSVRIYHLLGGLSANVKTFGESENEISALVHRHGASHRPSCSQLDVCRAADAKARRSSPYRRRRKASRVVLGSDRSSPHHWSNGSRAAAYLSRNWKFESCSLLQRVTLTAVVPRRRRRDLLAGHKQKGLASIGGVQVPTARGHLISVRSRRCAHGPTSAEKARLTLAADRALERGFDRLVPLVWRRFFYMPFHHSEDLADQRRSVALFGAVPRDPERGGS